MKLTRWFYCLSLILGSVLFMALPEAIAQSGASRSFTGEGGSHGNGNDTRHMNTKNWIMPGTNIDPNSLFSPDPSSILTMVDLFRATHPQFKTGACKANGKIDVSSRFPLPNDESRKNFSILVQTKGKKKANDLLCEDVNVLNAYREAFVVLHWLKEADEIGAYLISSIMKLSAEPIKIVIETKSRRYSGTSESAWYDPIDKAIHWSKFRDCEGMECLLGRNSANIMRHELMHVLTHRALKDKYPIVTKDHDPQYLAETEYLFDNDWIKNRTSVDAAYLEAIANVVERDNTFWTDHPYIKKWGDFASMNDDGCYSSNGEITWELAFLMFSSYSYGKKLLAHTDNEIYVSSTMQALTDDYDISDELRQGKLSSDYGTAYSTTSLPRIKNIIDAVTNYAPRNVREFAQAMNRVTGSDLGNRWYLEYYFEDLATGRNLSTMITYERKRDSNFGDFDQFCLMNKNDLSKFFSPALRARRDQVSKLSKATYAANLPTAILDQEIRDRISNFEATYQSVLPNWNVLILGYKTLENTLGKTQLCKSTENWCNYPENSLERKAAIAIYDKLGASGAVCDYSDYLKKASCGEFQLYRQDSERKIIALRKLWGALKNIPAKPKTAAYQAKIERLQSLKSETDFFFRNWSAFARTGATVIKNPNLVKGLK